MILEPHETQRFYRIWFPLLHYVTSLKRFVRFLFDTGRMDNDSAWHLLDFLRHYES